MAKQTDRLKQKKAYALNVIRLGIPEYEALEISGFTEKQIQEMLASTKFQREVSMLRTEVITECNQRIMDYACDTDYRGRAVSYKATQTLKEEIRPDLYRRDLQNTKLSASEERKRLAETTGISIKIG